MTKKKEKKATRVVGSKVTPRQRATASKTGRRERLMLIEAINSYAHWKGEAQYLRGYRAGSCNDSSDLYRKEMHRWERVGAELGVVTKALATFARAVRAK